MSAAMRRHVVDDSENELYTRFRYSPVKGLGYEPGVNRRDPSSIIKVGDLYYVWYTRCTDPKYKWLNADIWYATSPDGVNWTECGPAVRRVRPCNRENHSEYNRRCQTFWPVLH